MKQYVILPATPDDEALLKKSLQQGSFKVEVAGNKEKNTPEEKARILGILRSVRGSITSEEAKQWNEEIRRMRDEEWE